MKQHITKEQWDELSDKDKETYNKKYPNAVCGRCDSNKGIYDMMPKVNIGQMIEFLGDEWWHCDDICWTIFIGDEHGVHYVGDRELCDALWSSCKYKLQNSRELNENTSN